MLRHSRGKRFETVDDIIVIGKERLNNGLCAIYIYIDGEGGTAFPLLTLKKRK